jgi:putative transposase
MSRAWRIEYAGAYYHLMSRGNQGDNIFYDDKDRQVMLDTLGELLEQNQQI